MNPQNTTVLTEKQRPLPDASLLALKLDRNSGIPLHRQICNGIRDSILQMRVAPLSRLPSTRALAKDLGVSRNSVLMAFDQLKAEGYLVGSTGGGTRVRDFFPDATISELHQRPASTPSPEAQKNRLFNRTTTSSETPYVTPPIRPFAPGIPAIDRFPIDLWRRISNRCWREQGQKLLTQIEPGGFLPLREAIATHIRVARGVTCDPAQVLITAGAQQAFHLCCQVLLRPRDLVLFENPGYSGALGAFRYAGASLVPVSVDQEGMAISEVEAQKRKPTLAYVTPTHQFPLGMPMSLPRRLELVDWAQRENAWIMEDDYDSEYRFSGPPLPALYGLDESRRVIYIGTFSKSTFPALRIGFAVLPQDLVASFAKARAFQDHHSPVITQATLCNFIQNGHFARHIRDMRNLYRKRRDILVSSLAKSFGDSIAIPHSDTGLHVTTLLPAGVDDRLVSQEAARRGLMALPLTGFAQTNLARGGMVLGFGGMTEIEIREGVKVLEEVVSTVAGTAAAADH